MDADKNEDRTAKRAKAAKISRGII